MNRTRLIWGDLCPNVTGCVIVRFCHPEDIDFKTKWEVESEVSVNQPPVPGQGADSTAGNLLLLKVQQSEGLNPHMFENELQSEDF